MNTLMTKVKLKTKPSFEMSVIINYDYHVVACHNDDHLTALQVLKVGNLKKASAQWRVTMRKTYLPQRH